MTTSPRARLSRLLRAAMSVCLLAGFAMLTGCRGRDAGPPPVDPSVKISGPVGQPLSVGVGYVTDSGNTTGFRSSSFNLVLSEEGLWEKDLEDGVDGLVVEVFVPIDEPVTVEVFLEGKSHEKIVSSKPGRVRVMVGAKPHEDRELSYDIRPDADGKKFVQSVLDGLTGGSFGDLISTDPELVAVDEILLNEMMKIATKRFGAVKSVHPARWTQGDGNHGMFVTYNAHIEFADGTLFRFVMFVSDGKLAALNDKAIALGTDWWKEAAFGDTYLALGRSMITDMIEKRYDDAYARSGPMLKEKMSLAQFKAYREQLPLPDAPIEKIDYVDGKTEDIDSEIDRRVQQSFKVTFEGGTVWDAKVNYNFVVDAGWKVGEIIGVEMEEAK